MEGKFVTVKEFAGYFQFEQLTGDEESLKRVIELTDTNRPGLELAGFFDYSQAKRLVILGDKEIAYMVVFTQCLECVVSAVCHKILRNIVGIEHHSQSDGAEHSADRDHCRESNHSLCEVL